MYRALVWLLKYINIHVLYVFMSVCVIPVTMLISAGARVTYRYFRKIRGCGRWRSIWYTYKNHCVFGQTVIDKFAMYAGHKFKIRFVDFEDYRRLAEGDEPIIQLNAHIGCNEILGYSCHVEKPCNILVFGGEKESLMGFRRSAFQQMNAKMIPVGIGTTHSEDIADALDRGEIVCAFADRFFNAKKTITSTLHGHKISLARGPFSLAVTRGLNVVMLSGMKESDGSYTAYFTPLSYDKTLSKSEQRQQIADAYTAEIERLLGKYPMQWFNYANSNF